MRPPFIGTVSVFLKLMPHIVATTHAVKKPPEALILELREIGDRILCRSNCGTLCCTDMGTNSLVDPIAGFHGFSVCGWCLHPVPPTYRQSDLQSSGRSQTPTIHDRTSSHLHLRCCAIPSIPATTAARHPSLRMSPVFSAAGREV